MQQNLFNTPSKDFPLFPGIYLIYTEINNSYYVGSSINLRSRLCDHRKSLKANYHSNYKLQEAFNTYGKGAFQYKILYQYDHLIEYNSEEYQNSLLVKEKYFIEQYLKYPLYNIVLDPTLQLPAIPKYPVYQYDSKGNFIQEWESAFMVQRHLHVQIRTAITRKIKAKGYFWSRKKYEHLDLSFLKDKNRGSGSKSKKEVSLYNIIGKRIKTFNSIRDLAREINVPTNYVNTSIKTTKVITGTRYRASLGHKEYLDNDINLSLRTNFIIVQCDLNDVPIKVFPSINAAQAELHLTSIFDNISGKTKKSGNFKFKRLSNELVKSCELLEVPQSLIDRT